MHVLNVALRLLGLPRRKPTTRAGKILRRCEHGVVALVVLYVLLSMFPQVLLRHSLSAHGIRLYSSAAIPEEAEALLGQVRSRAAGSELWCDGDRFTVCVCNDQALYAFFSPRNRHAFGTTNAMSKILIGGADFGRDRCRAQRPDYNERSFVGVVTHEIGHCLMRKRFGLLRYVRLPDWLTEGYSEYLAGESGYPEAEGDRLLAQGDCDRPGAFQYLVRRRMVEYLIRQKGLSIGEIASNPPPERQVQQEMCQWLRQLDAYR